MGRKKRKKIIKRGKKKGEKNNFDHTLSSNSEKPGELG